MLKNSSKIKVAIVGAGTIGLYLAWKLSQAGHKVIVFEKNSKILAKPCSGLISERLKNYLSLDNSLIEARIKSCLIHFPKKTTTLNLKPIHYLINSQKLNEKLARLAESSGAEILFNHLVDEIPQGFDKVIGSDGALSKIRKKLGLPQPSFRLGLQIFIPQQPAAEELEQVEVWPIQNGFFWRIPRTNGTEYGLIDSPETALSNFKKLLFHYRSYDLGKLGKVLEERKTALIPSSLVLPKNKNITLSGDAAGLTKPWSGGGVIWGLRAAEILIKNFPDFEKYHQEIKKFFGPKILKGKFSTHLTYFLGNHFPYVLPSKISRDNDFPIF